MGKLILGLLGEKASGPKAKGGRSSDARKAAAKALLAAIEARDAEALSEALGLHGSCHDELEEE